MGIRVVVLLAVLVGGLYGLVRRVEPGPWLEVAGVMLHANQSGTMASAWGSDGGAASEKAKKARYYVRGTRSNNPALMLVDEDGLKKGVDVDKEEAYRSDGYVVIETWKVGWCPWRRVFKTARKVDWRLWRWVFKTARAVWERWIKRKP